MKKPKKLHLILKGQWFDMIDSGIKKEEYRTLKMFWERRLLCFPGMGFYKENWVDFETIIFQHGYAKDARRMEIEFKGFELGMGRPEWGGDGSIVFILKLGEIISRNYKNVA